MDAGRRHVDGALARLRTPACAAALLLGALLPGLAWGQVYRCPDATGKVTYQGKPCDAATVATPAATAPINTTGNVMETAPRSVAVVPKGAAPAPKIAPAAPRAPEPDPRYQRAELGLAAGMDVRNVVERWGLPTDIRTERNYTFMHWCDMRIALLIDGVLQSWDAPFADSRAAIRLFKYGEPWTAAVHKWGKDRRNQPFTGPMLEKGEVQRWTELRWIVTDSHGNIVSWCDAAEHRSPSRPPAFNPPWDTPGR